MLLLLCCQELNKSESSNLGIFQRKKQQPNKELPVVLDTLKLEGVAYQRSVLPGMNRRNAIVMWPNKTRDSGGARATNAADGPLLKRSPHLSPPTKVICPQEYCWACFQSRESNLSAHFQFACSDTTDNLNNSRQASLWNYWFTDQTGTPLQE